MNHLVVKFGTYFNIHYPLPIVWRYDLSTIELQATKLNALFYEKIKNTDRLKYSETVPDFERWFGKPTVCA